MDSQEKLRPERTLFYDVDTQRDFMLPGGALHVPGSENILPALKHLTDLARRRKIRRICSTDRHFPGDRELARNGGPWPDHCMDGTAGQRKVEETAPSNPHPLPAHGLGATNWNRAEARRRVDHRKAGRRRHRRQCQRTRVAVPAGAAIRPYRGLRRLHRRLRRSRGQCAAGTGDGLPTSSSTRSTKSILPMRPRRASAGASGSQNHNLRRTRSPA